MDLHSPQYIPKPSGRPLWFIRAKRNCRLWLGAWFSACVAPFTDASGVFNIVALVVSGAAGVWARGYDAVKIQITDTWGIVHALAIAIAVYVVLCAIRALFVVRGEEQSAGEWHGAKFVYREPRVVFFRRVTDADNFKPCEFSISDGEPGGFVELRVECDGMERLARVQIVQTAMPDDIAKVGLVHSQMCTEYNTTMAVPYDKKFKMMVIKNNPNPTIVRVFLLAWGAD